MIPSSVYLMEVDIRPDHNEQSMGRSLAGSERMIAGPTALWTANLSVLVSNAAYEEWTGFLDGLRGSEKFFNYFPTGEGQLIPSATPVTWENNAYAVDPSKVSSVSADISAINDDPAATPARFDADWKPTANALAYQSATGETPRDDAG